MRSSTTTVRTLLSAAITLSMAASAMAQKSHQYDNDATIAINDFTSATPYPATVTVSGVSAPIGEVKVLIRGLTHTYPSDIGMMLVGPGGQNVVLMGRVAGTNPGVTGVNYMFSQDAVPLSITGANSPTGRYRPTNFGSNGYTVFAAPAPAGPYGTSLDVFKGQAANGTWSLYVNDEGTGDVGSIAGWSLIIEEAPAFANERAISIPAGSPAVTAGTAGPFPSTITVDGLAGTVRSVRVMLSGLSHTYPRDVRIMLSSPAGQTCLLDGNCGNSVDTVGADLIFDDNAPSALPDGAPIVAGTYRPTVGAFFVNPPSPNLAAPAPAGPYGAALSVFNGTAPNGMWKLWIEDSTGGDYGSLAGGWSLIINGQSCPADFNKSGGLEVQDIFDFLNAWLANCP